MDYIHPHLAITSMKITQSAAQNAGILHGMHMNKGMEHGHHDHTHNAGTKQEGRGRLRSTFVCHQAKV